MNLRIWIFAILLSGLSFAQDLGLRVTTPTPLRDSTIMTSEPAITLAGTLDLPDADTRILWESNRGFSDRMTVAAAEDGKSLLWTSVAPIPLRPGVNHVQITAPGHPGAGTSVNIFYTPTSAPLTPPQRTITLHGQKITYEEIDGMAIFQGDIILGTAREVAAGRFRGRLAVDPRQGARTEAATTTTDATSRSGLWPIVAGVARVPYIITNNVDTANITTAVNQANTQLAGVLQWVPATANDLNSNYVNFNLTSGNQSGTCQSSIGMVGNGVQYVTGGGNCVSSVLIHEMGHAIGLFHEQSRNDRDGYVTYNENNIDKPQYSNLEKYSSGVDSGLFNYASRMAYQSVLFARDGVSTVLETIPAGIPLSTSATVYTTGDMDGILRLYGHAPTSVTVDTNPTGMQIVVDGTTYPAPQVFAWAIGSQHTLSVPLDAHSQTLQNFNSQNYIFGRWNAAPPNQQSVTITNTAGDGTLMRPTGSPAITTYVANFIPIHVFNPSAGNGTVSVTPTPSTIYIGNTLTNYFIDRQVITITVTPNANYNFYYWANVSLYNYHVNPYTFPIQVDFPSSAVAVLTTSPVTTISATAPDLTSANTFPGFGIAVLQNGNVANYAYTPMTFSTSDSGFSPGATVTFCGTPTNGACPATPTATYPVTYNIQYTFSNWTGDATASTDGLTVTNPSTGHKTYVAHYTGNFRSLITSGGYCPGQSVTANPAGANYNSQNGSIDAFFNAGNVSFTATPGSGMSFLGWSQDLSGTANPLSYNLTNQVLGTANFNLTGIAAPLTITSLSPAAFTTTASARTLTINGTGFPSSTANVAVFFGYGSNTYRQPTSSTPTQIVVPLNAGDLSSPGAYTIVVENYTGSCSVQTTATLVVSNSPGPPVLTISTSHSGNFTAGQTNAQYTISVTNSGASPTSAPVTVIDTLPPGETLGTMGGTGWTCISTLCSRPDALPSGQSYPAIAVTVSVAGNATSPQVNAATVSGGGAYSVPSSDSTTINTQATVPSVAGLSQSAATTAIQNAGLVVGTVTQASSSTVAAGNVISSTPIAGTVVAVGSSVNLVVSTGPPGLQSIAVTPANPSVAKGLTKQFTATGTFADNSTQDLTNQVTWTSLTPANATINATTGLATAVAVGQSTIKATSGAVSGSTVLTVTAATLVSINVTPSGPSIAKGLTQQFTATGTYTDNSTQDLTSQVTWSSLTPANATINATTGLATAAAVGQSTIKATLGAVNGSTVLTVTAATLVSINVTPTGPSIAKGLTQQFTATGTYTDSTTLDLTGQVAWSSLTPANATINATTGLATAVAVGQSTIKATLGAVNGSTVLTVTAATLVSINVTPTGPSIAKGLTQQFTATGTYTDSTTQDLTTQVAWSSLTPANATINATTGLATAVAVGQSTIKATLSGINGTTVLTVTAATLQSIAVTPGNPSIAKGLTRQFTATGTYTDNSTQDLTGQATWSSTSTAAATINTSGLATGAGVGQSTIKATFSGVTGSTVLTVTAATLQSITVTPLTPSIVKTLTLQFAATGTYSDNSTQTLTSQVTWASGTQSVATINNSGLATALTPGPSTISATLGAVQGSTVLTVLNFSKCDVNQDTITNIGDVQWLVVHILSNSGGTDLNADGLVNVLDGQTLVNSLISGVCSAT